MLLPALLVAQGACGTGADGAGDASAADATVSLETSPPAPDTLLDSVTVAEPEITTNTDDPFRVFGLESQVLVDATIDTTAVWLVNELASALVVTAEGGAGAVVIDTIGPADSVLVQIETRAAFVQLSARTSADEPAGTASLRADGTPARVAFPR